MICPEMSEDLLLLLSRKMIYWMCSLICLSTFGITAWSIAIGCRLAM